MAKSYTAPEAYTAARQYAPAWVDPGAGIPGSYTDASIYNFPKPYTIGGMGLVARTLWYIDEAAQRPWAQWLGTWFDGAAHELGGVTHLFPPAALAFDRDDLPQVLPGLGIHLVSEAAPAARSLTTIGTRVLAPVRWLIFVRAGGLTNQYGNPAHRARLGADLLHALLRDPAATAGLAREGIHDLRSLAPRALSLAPPVYLIQVSARVDKSTPHSLPGPEATARAVDALGQESTDRLWWEWLSRYYDGAFHVVNGEVVTVPAAVLGTGVHALAQPLAEPHLSIAYRTEARGVPRSYTTHTGRLHAEERETLFLFRARGPTLEEAAWKTRRAADLLFLLLQDAGAMAPLARQGILDLVVEKPRVVPDADFVTREVRARYRTYTQSLITIT